MIDFKPPLLNGYAIKSSEDTWFTGNYEKNLKIGKSTPVFTPSKTMLMFHPVKIFNNLNEAKEMAKTLSTSKWLSTFGQPFEVVDIYVHQFYVEHKYNKKSWLRKIFGRPNDVVFHHPEIEANATIWSTSD